MVLAETTGAETVRYWHALDTLAQSDGTTTEYLAYDGLGSVRQLVDETGLVTLAQTFDPYGSGYATSGSASSRLGWTGEQIDSERLRLPARSVLQPRHGSIHADGPVEAGEEWVPLCGVESCHVG